MRNAALRSSHTEINPSYLAQLKRARGACEGIAAGVDESAPACRYHGETMKLVVSAHPVVLTERARKYHAETKRRLRERRIWRCCVKGCPSVASVRGEDLAEPETEI